MTKSTAAIPLVLMLLTGCVGVLSDCPAPRTIPADVQARAAQELALLPPGSAIGKVLAAGLDDRDKLRACRKIR
jgi:hypothetical protein